MRRTVLVLGLCLSALPSYAQDTAAVFAALDADRNGAISAMEAEKNDIVSAAFAAADRDGNGALSREEFDAAFG